MKLSLLLAPKLATRIMVLSAVGLFAAGLAATTYDATLYRTERAREIAVQADILAASVTAALSFDDRTAAQEYVDALAVNPDLEAAGVYNPTGAAVAGFTRAGAAPLPPSPAVENPSFQGGHLTVVTPVTMNGSTLGKVYLRAIPESLGRRLARYGGIALLTVMTALVLLVLGAAHTAATRANEQLERHARDLAAVNAKLHTEIEEREKAEEALRHSQKMEAIGQLSGGIAHDFNNLLTIIKGNLQLLQRRLNQGTEGVQRYIDSAMAGADRASSLTQRILAFSRRQPLSPKPVNLTQLVQNMADFLRQSVGTHIAVNTSLGANWWTMCDASQMENVILNLAFNSRDAMPEGGTLSIETSDRHVTAAVASYDGVAPGDYVELRVSDTGEGMSEEVRTKAIDPFFTTKPPGLGTGLGLSMTFGYVRQSNGYLSIDSELGKGTTITILMPRYEDGVAAASESIHGNERRA